MVMRKKRTKKIIIFSIIIICLSGCENISKYESLDMREKLGKVFILSGEQTAQVLGSTLNELDVFSDQELDTYYAVPAEPYWDIGEDGTVLFSFGILKENNMGSAATYTMYDNRYTCFDGKALQDVYTRVEEEQARLTEYFGESDYTKVYEGARNENGSMVPFLEWYSDADSFVQRSEELPEDYQSAIGGSDVWRYGENDEYQLEFTVSVSRFGTVYQWQYRSVELMDQMVKRLLGL